MDDEYEHMTMHDSSVLCACCGDEKSDEQRKTRMKSIYMDTPYDPHLVETHNTTIVGRHLLHDLTPSHHHTLSEA
jgi:hypothetical protein